MCRSFYNSYRKWWLATLVLIGICNNKNKLVVKADLDTICNDGGPGCTTKLLFDALTRMQGESEFDPIVWFRIKSCMERTNPNGNVTLLQISDTAYTAAVAYATANSPNSTTFPLDPWAERIGVWQENNATPLIPPGDTSIPGGSNFLVNGPCNVISNFAYYRGMLAICENSFGINPETVPWLITQAAHQGFGSNVFHAALNSLGINLDVLPIENYAFIGHQSLVRSLPYSPITHELSETPRPYSGIEAAQEFDRILIEEDPLTEWLLSVRALRREIPGYFETFAASLITVFLLTLPEPVVMGLIDLVAPLVVVDEEVLVFLTQMFIPSIKQAFKDANVRLRFRAKSALLRKTVGVLIKLLYAGYWEEEVFTGPHLSSVVPNQVGGLLIPAVNAFANALTRYDRSSDRGVQFAIGVYPSEERCRKGVFAHSKWHEMSANLYVDFLLLVEDINDAIVGRRIFNIADSDLWNCFTANKCFDEFEFSSSSESNNEEDDQQPTEATIMEDCVPADPLHYFPYTGEGIRGMMECLALGGPSTRRKLSNTQQQVVLSCIAILLDPGSIDVDDSLEEQCQRLSLTNTTFQNFGFATGLPKLASCAARSCRFSYIGMIATFAGMPSCVRSCKESGHNVIHCLIGCYAGFNFAS